MAHGARLAEGREAEVFAHGDGAVLKLLRDADRTDRVAREAAALRALAAGGYRVPRVLDVVVVDGRPGLVLERVPGDDLLTALGRNPLALRRAARALADAHDAMHDHHGPPELPTVHDVVSGRIAAAEPLPDDLRAAALALLATLPGGDALCHGDMHLGNMLGTWTAPVVIDWGDAARGHPAADVARTALLHRVGEPPPGAPFLVRRLAPVGRRALAALYLARYRRVRPLERDLVERWVVVRAAARLAEPIPAEHPRLLAIVRAGMAAAPP